MMRFLTFFLLLIATANAEPVTLTICGIAFATICMGVLAGSAAIGVVIGVGSSIYNVIHERAETKYQRYYRQPFSFFPVPQDGTPVDPSVTKNNRIYTHMLSCLIKFADKPEVMTVKQTQLTPGVLINLVANVLCLSTSKSFFRGHKVRLLIQVHQQNSIILIAKNQTQATEMINIFNSQNFTLDGDDASLYYDGIDKVRGADQNE